MSVFGVHAVLGDGDFFDRVDRRRVGRLEAGAERHAVEQHVVGATRAAARVVVVGVGVVVGPVLVGRRRGRDARIERRQVVRIASGDRHLIDELLLEREIGAGTVKLHRDRRRLDDHPLLDVADAQRQIDGEVRALLHAHVALLRRLEPLELGQHRVDARIDEVENVVAVRVGHAGDGDAGRVVSQRHRRARQGGLTRVDDRALDSRPVVLRLGAGGHETRHANVPSAVPIFVMTILLEIIANLGALPLHSTAGIAGGEPLHFADRHVIEVPGNRLLERARRDRERERGLGVRAHHQPEDQTGRKTVAAADAIDEPDRVTLARVERASASDRTERRSTRCRWPTGSRAA